MIQPFWSLGPFFVAGVKSLGCLGKCARERGFMPTYGRSVRAGAWLFSMPFGLYQKTLVLDIFGYVDVGGE